MASIYTLLKESLDKHSDKAALSTKNEGEYESITYKELSDMVENFASGMIYLGIEPKGNKECGERIAIMSENRVEFIVADLANYALGNVTVPIYTTYTPKKIKDIIQDSGATTVIASTQENYDKIIKALEIPDLMHEPVNSNYPNILMAMDDVSYTQTFNEVLERGKENPCNIEEISKNVEKEDLAILMYTSGTTGKPKGVMLVHDNIMSNILDIEKAFPMIGTEARSLSVIPYSHAFEHTGALALLYKGAEIGFAENPPATVGEDLLIFKPNMMLAVPRLYEKVLDKIKMGLATSKVKRKLFDKAMSTKEKYLQATESGKKPGFMLNFMNKKFDKIVFQKIREKTGGNLEMCITGGGPLSPEIEDVFTRKIGIALYNGYGLTETSPVVSANDPNNHRKGSIGKPLKSADVQIINGEIAVNGPMVFKGYWKDEEKTKEVFTEKNGKKYFLTGDKGKLEDGYLFITGRMKNDIRLNTGQNIGLAEELEEPLLSSVLISQLMIHGQAEPYITGLIVPNFEYLKATLQLDKKQKKTNLDNIISKMQDFIPEHPVSFEERKAYATNHKTYELLEKTIDRINKDLGLEDYASLKKFVILPTELTENSGLMTPTMKIKRNEVLKHYKELFDLVYDR